MSIARLLPVLLAFLVASLAPARASAFCGFFVSGAGGPLVNDATQVALMRDGVRTVLTMRNSYKGPPEDFALVIPVPVVLQQSQVRTLPPQVFDRLDQLTAPRLVEYWEQDPCQEEISFLEDREGGTGSRAKAEEGSMGGPRGKVRVEAEFAVDEYDIVILSADDSLALADWLVANRYKMPPGVEPHLRPYVQAGSKFFVAKVNVQRVKFLWGRAVLSPLRFHYDSDVFSLPIRLGLANADGPQDLVVYVLAHGQRYEVGNYDNVFIPTNLEVRDEARKIFSSFYATLFDRTVAGKPRAVVTEYSWDASSCDPCPVPPLEVDTLAQLGADVVPDPKSNFVVTRLHARYGPDTLGEDFVFRKVDPVAGGQEDGSLRRRGRGGQLSLGTAPTKGATPSARNAFQGRYIIRHAWDGPIECSHPEFGVWGGPPGGDRPPPPSGMSTRVRRDVPLGDLILAEAPTAEGRSPAPAARERSQWDLLLLRVQRIARRAPWLPFAAFALGLAAVIVSLRKSLRDIPRATGTLLLLASLPVAFVLSREPRYHLREAMHGHALIAAYELAAGLLVALSVRARRRPPAQLWVWALIALMPAAAGVLDHRAGLANTISVARSMGDDPTTHVRVLLQGESEALQSLVVGAACSAVLLAYAAFELAGHLARGAAPRGALRGAMSALAAWAAVIAIVLARPQVRIDTHWPRLLALAVLLASAALALRLSRRWPEGPAARPAFLAAQLRGAWLLSLSAVAVSVAAAARAKSEGLSAASGASVDPSQATRVLESAFTEVERFVWRAPLLAAAALTPLVVLWARARAGAPRQPARPGSDAAPARATPAPAEQSASLARATRVFAVVSAAAVLGLDFLYQAEVARLHALHPKLTGPDRLDSVGHLTPAPSAAFGAVNDVLDHGFGGPALLVDSQGRLLASTSATHAPESFGDALYLKMGEPTADAGARPEPLLVSDGALSLDRLYTSLTPLLSRRQTTFRWVAFGGARPDDVSGLGVYADITEASPRRGTIDVEVLPRVEVRAGAPGEARSPRAPFAALLRLDQERRTLRALSGANGRYRTLPGEKPVLIHGSSNVMGSPSSRSWLSGAREVVFYAPPQLDVAAVTAAMLDLLEGRDRYDRADQPTFVLTSDIGALAQGETL